MQLDYPATRHELASLTGLSSRGERQRMSAAALHAFFNTMDKWSVRDEDARRLLGGVASSTFCDYKRNPDRVQDQDKLTRVSYLIGIFKALNILHGSGLADRWVTMPNRNRVFGGGTPLDYMVRGGTAAMHVIRRLLDARRAGR